MAKTSRFVILLAVGVLMLGRGAAATHVSFERGDLFISLETGPVQWRLADGTLIRLLVPTVIGTGEGMAFDAHGNLYVARWCVDSSCSTGNTVEMYDVLGRSWGAAASGFDCAPHALVFEANGTAYVGQAGCRRSILKFVPSEIGATEFRVAEDFQGVFWVDLAADGCTIFYTSYGPNVKRFDTCAGVQLADFNQQPMPGGSTQDLRILPDGGVLVSSGSVIARLDAAGALLQTYGVAGAAYWSGVDLVGDGTFWAGNYETSDVCRFDLAGAGGPITCFNAAAPPHSVVGVRIMPAS